MKSNCFLCILIIFKTRIHIKGYFSSFCIMYLVNNYASNKCFFPFPRICCLFFFNALKVNFFSSINLKLNPCCFNHPVALTLKANQMIHQYRDNFKIIFKFNESICSLAMTQNLKLCMYNHRKKF